MKKLSITSATFLILTSASTLALAAPVADTITTFESGTPAVAADVNANFATLKNAININDGEATTHAADAAAHHSKYTNAEATAAATTAAGAAVATHTAVTDAHHTKYTNAEAISAADAQISTHTAIINAHHDKYTDPQAVSAVITAGGAGSNIDADFLDGMDSTDFVSSLCPSDMVKVGPICIDKYEASVTDLGGTTTDQTACTLNGGNCSATDNTGTVVGSAIFAKSVAGVAPATSFTWFQAQQACANVGKRLPTNAEWQMAAAGTPNPTGTADCVVNAAGVMENTGSRAACVSNYGAFDMVGNTLEWVADWVTGGGTDATLDPSLERSQSASVAYGDDRIIATRASGDGGTNNMPAAVLRGGSSFTATAEAGIYFYSADVSPATSSTAVGFRCAK